MQSHWFSVGPIVPWAKAGVGAVATQANVEVAYGPRGLELLERGADAPAALRQLLDEDPRAASRQVAIVDAPAGWRPTPARAACRSPATARVDGVSCQANIMAADTVWPAMLAAYERHQGSLTERLLAALDAAELEGGDIRGRQSAALFVVPAAGQPWDTVISLRVEDHPDPLDELARLVRLNEAYTLAGRGDERVAEGRHEEAATLYLEASRLAPESHELQFWAGLGRRPDGRPRGRSAPHPGRRRRPAGLARAPRPPARPTWPRPPRLSAPADGA